MSRQDGTEISLSLSPDRPCADVWLADFADVYSSAAEENIGVNMDEEDGEGVPARVELGFGDRDEGDLGVRMELRVW